MTEWIQSLAGGLVQGLSEFLPISSDGHLTLLRLLFDWIEGRKSSGEQNLFFIIFVHLGTLAAILIRYRAVGVTGAKGLLLGSEAVPPEYRRWPLVRTGLMVVVATLPAVVVGLTVKKYIEAAFESLTAVGVGFLISAAVLLASTVLKGGEKGPATMTWLDALLIGVAQAFAPLPGVSRSGLTIASALGLGLSRSWAVGFSLLMAIPAILGGAVLELKDVDKSTLGGELIAQCVAAAVVAGVVGYGAIIWLVRIVRAGRMWYFSVYLIVLGLAVLAVAMRGGRGRGDGGRADHLDRPVRVARAGPGTGGAGGPVARPGPAGARRPDPGAGRAGGDGPAPRGPHGG